MVSQPEQKKDFNTGPLSLVVVVNYAVNGAKQPSSGEDCTKPMTWILALNQSRLQHDSVSDI